MNERPLSGSSNLLLSGRNWVFAAATLPAGVRIPAAVGIHLENNRLPSRGWFPTCRQGSANPVLKYPLVHLRMAQLRLQFRPTRGWHWELPDRFTLNVVQAKSDRHTLPAIDSAPLRFPLNGPLIPQAINFDGAGKMAGAEHAAELTQRRPLSSTPYSVTLASERPVVG